MRENGSQFDQRSMDFGIFGPLKIAQPLRAGPNDWREKVPSGTKESGAVLSSLRD